ncbi:hypothetical protein [Anaerobacterium chartisolvens]|nr:hypothetical protein [Anaerobacterium chartisolvens]
MSKKLQNLLTSVGITAGLIILSVYNWNSICFYFLIAMCILLCIRTSYLGSRGMSVLNNLPIFVFYFGLGLIIVFMPDMLANKNTDFSQAVAKVRNISPDAAKQFGITAACCILLNVVVKIIGKKKITAIANTLCITAFFSLLLHYVSWYRSAFIILAAISIAACVSIALCPDRCGLGRFVYGAFFSGLLTVFVFVLAGDYLVAAGNYLPHAGGNMTTTFFGSAISAISGNFLNGWWSVGILAAIAAAAIPVLLHIDDETVSNIVCSTILFAFFCRVLLFAGWSWIVFTVYAIAQIVACYLSIDDCDHPWENLSILLQGAIGAVLLGILVLIRNFNAFIESWWSLTAVGVLLAAFLIAAKILNYGEIKKICIDVAIVLLFMDVLRHLEWDWLAFGVLVVMGLWSVAVNINYGLLASKKLVYYATMIFMCVLAVAPAWVGIGG